MANAFKLAHQPRHEEIVEYAYGDNIDTTWVLSTRQLPVGVLKDTVMCGFVSTYKDGWSLSLTGGYNYTFNGGLDQLKENSSGNFGASLRSDGQIGWYKVVGKDLEVVGYRFQGKTIRVASQEEDRVAPCYFKWEDGRLLVSSKPQEGFEEGEVLLKEVDKKERVAPFGAELNVSFSGRPYEKGAASEGLRYWSYSTTFYGKWRFFQDKAQMNGLALYFSVGYVFSKDNENIVLGDKTEVFSYTGSGVTGGVGLEYRLQFPLTVGSDRKSNGFIAGSAMDIKVGVHWEPWVRPSLTKALYYRPVAGVSVSFDFGLGRNVRTAL